MSTVFQQHIARWSNCRRCRLCEGRQSVVLARGRVPCDILFVGEAPGESENVIGRPFVGPAGKLLDHIISRSIPNGVTYAISNLVACIPCAVDGANAGPSAEEIAACAPRLTEFVRMCNPKLVVCVGALARDSLDPKYLPLHPAIKKGQKTIDITHPAAILRLNTAQRGLAIQKAVITIASAMMEDLTGGYPAQ